LFSLLPSAFCLLPYYLFPITYYLNKLCHLLECTKKPKIRQKVSLIGN
jgi:hypothetical protein